MKPGVLLGWGIVIYAMISFAWSGMGAYGWTQGIAPSIIELLVLFATCVIAGAALKFRTWKDILPYSIGWALIAAALDAVFTAPSGDWSVFSQWTTWAGYALIALFPLCATFFRREHSHGGAWET